MAARHHRNPEQAPAITVPTPDPRAANGIKTAVFARAPIIPGEEAAARQDVTQAYLDAFQPRNQVEVDAVLAIVDATWRLRRLARAEAALHAAAEAQARQVAPQTLAVMTNAIRQARTDVAILQRVLDGIAEVFDPATPEVSQRRLKAFAVVVDRVLDPGCASIADMRLEDAAARIGRCIEARTAEVTRAERRLASVAADHQAEVDGHVALAGLLDARVADRLERERSAIERSRHRAQDNLERLRGGAAIHVLVATAGHSAEANLRGDMQARSGDFIEVSS